LILIFFQDVDVQRQAIHFKNRVLDLVDIFLKKQPTNPCVIRCILPLVDLLTSTATDEQQVADKTKGVLRSRIGKQKEGPSTLDHKHLTTILGEIHVRSRKAHSRETLETLSQCSLYLVRLLLRADQEESVLRIYRQSLIDFITRKNSTLNTGFFEELVRPFPMTAWKMRSDILDLNTKAANVFRRCQAFQMLQILLSRVSTVCAILIIFG
jgi:DNA polymerase phi